MITHPVNRKMNHHLNVLCIVRDQNNTTASFTCYNMHGVDTGTRGGVISISPKNSGSEEEEEEKIPQ